MTYTAAELYGYGTLCMLLGAGIGLFLLYQHVDPYRTPERKFHLILLLALGLGICVSGFFFGHTFGSLLLFLGTIVACIPIPGLTYYEWWVKNKPTDPDPGEPPPPPSPPNVDDHIAEILKRNKKQ